MSSALIISDYLGEIASEVDAAERGVITTWEEFGDKK
jgi:hypothetical protein